MKKTLHAVYYIGMIALSYYTSYKYSEKLGGMLADIIIK